MRVEGGLRLATPGEVLLACGRDLGLLDMVVLCDAAVRTERCRLEDLEAAARLRRRGAPMLRRVLPLVDARSESAWESVLRMLHHACDVAVEPQHVIEDEHGGFVARADLLVVGTRALHEYDGEHHLRRRRQRSDLARVRRIDHEGYIRRGYTNHAVLDRAVGILRDADTSLGRPHRPSRIRAWHSLLRDSLFTPSGTAKVVERWARRTQL